MKPGFVRQMWLISGGSNEGENILGWNPQKTSYEELVRIMAEHDLKLAKQEATVRAAADTRKKRIKDMMEKESKIFIAGHKGMVGSAIIRALKRRVLYHQEP